jgi:hypothetical protein
MALVIKRNTPDPTSRDKTLQNDEEAANQTIRHAKIGQLALENDFLAGALTKAGLRSAKP